MTSPVAIKSLTCIVCMKALAGLCLLYGQSGSINKQKETVITANRKNAKPRPVAPSVPLSKEDLQREAIFKKSKKSIVYISARPKDSNTKPAEMDYPVPGSGFVWDEMGHVVTNYHVVAFLHPESGLPKKEADNVVVTLHNGMKYDARIIGRSLAYDIAVLHVFAPLADMNPLPMGNSKELRVGQSVVALGNPFGLSHTLTTGIISSLGRKLYTKYGTPVQDVIQTDAALNPGNLGGPLMDMSGRLVGMNSLIESTSGSSAGIGFAIPSHTLNEMVPKLIEKAQQGWPEMGFTLLRPERAQEIGVKQGLVVADVQEGSFAQQAGLKPWTFQLDRAGKLKVNEIGDLILGLEGELLLNELHLFVKMEVHPKGKPFVLDVLRGDKPIQVVIDPWNGKSKTPLAEKLKAKS